jgi:Asp-tRNA(Asn)/Glu-tRNA(Gln) amidotransferase A subunit family amidase
MMPFNVTGQPSMAVRCGLSANGLPLSLQIAGKPFGQATVLRVGHAYEQATGWHRWRPPLAATR